jgi:ankyrin repeat protein
MRRYSLRVKGILLVLLPAAAMCLAAASCATTSKETVGGEAHFDPSAKVKLNVEMGVMPYRLELAPMIAGFLGKGIAIVSPDIDDPDLTLSVSIEGRVRGVEYKADDGTTKVVNSEGWVGGAISIKSREKTLYESNYSGWNTAPKYITKDYYQPSEALVSEAFQRSDLFFFLLKGIDQVFGESITAKCILGNSESKEQLIIDSIVHELAIINDDMYAALAGTGIDIDLRDSHHRTALYAAMEYGFEPKQEANSVRLLLELGANPHVTIDPDSGYDKTPLERATVDSNKYVCESMFAAVKDLDELVNGRSVLHYAAFMHRTDAIKIMLAHGANVNVRDVEGKTPVMYAVSNSTPGKAVRMYKGRPYWDSKFDLGKMLDTLGLLIDSGADVDAQSVRGRTALMMAVETQSQPAIQMLLSAKPNLQIKESTRGWTAMDYANDKKNQEIASLLGK